LNEAKTGLSLTEVWRGVRRLCLDIKQAVSTKSGLSGRLSELAGLGLVISAPIETELVDESTMKFQATKKAALVSDRRGHCRRALTDSQAQTNPSNIRVSFIVLDATTR